MRISIDFMSLLRPKVILMLLFLSPGIFAAPTIQERSFQGASAAEARLKLIAAAESYLGTPYRYAGLDRRGLDCSGLVFLSFREGLKYSIPRTSEGIYDWAEKIDTEELQPGDLVFFVTTGQGVSHLGIYAGEGRFIHSASEGPQTGVMYSHLDEVYWKRTYIGAGRALPWDAEAAEAMSAARSGVSVEPGVSAPVWADPGFFVGFGAALTIGGFFEGAPSFFRGFSALGTAGYKWSKYRAGLELRPEWDGALGVFRFPLTLSMGTDIFQVFLGPAYTFGEPVLSLSERGRHYAGGNAWLWELGFSAAFPAMELGRGLFSLYGELAWQPYRVEGELFSIKPDITANMRVSTGLRYLWCPL